jgi:hypothetical protein
MHVASSRLYTLIHASVTRGEAAIDEAGVLRGYRGVVVHDRLAMYWRLKAKHAVCGAHLLRDLAKVATVATQAAWATGLAALLVDINLACSSARRRGLKSLGPQYPAGLRRSLRRLGRPRPRCQPRPAARKRAGLLPAQVLQPGHRLCQAPPAHLEVHVRPADAHDQQPGRARPQAHEVTPENIRLFPQPTRGRALRPPAQLPLHHTQERRTGHHRSCRPVRRQTVDAALAPIELNTYNLTASPKHRSCRLLPQRDYLP